MKQILIKFPDEMADSEAMRYVDAVIKQGKISEFGKLYCYVTGFVNDVYVSVSRKAKYPTFIIWKHHDEKLKED